MAGRKAFLVRIDPAVLDAVQRWADEDLRSLNGQIEFILRRALQQKGAPPLAHRTGSYPPPTEGPYSPRSE